VGVPPIVLLAARFRLPDRWGMPHLVPEPPAPRAAAETSPCCRSLPAPPAQAAGARDRSPAPASPGAESSARSPLRSRDPTSQSSAAPGLLRPERCEG
jgi:hypothetical protein